MKGHVSYGINITNIVTMVVVMMMMVQISQVRAVARARVHVNKVVGSSRSHLNPKISRASMSYEVRAYRQKHE